MDAQQVQHHFISQVIKTHHCPNTTFIMPCTTRKQQYQSTQACSNEVPPDDDIPIASIVTDADNQSIVDKLVIIPLRCTCRDHSGDNLVNVLTHIQSLGPNLINALAEELQRELFVLLL